MLPSAIADLVAKSKKGIAQADSAVPSLPGVLPNPAEIRMSRTAYERTRALQPTGNVQADKNDTGNVECWELWVKLVPSENKIYEGTDVAGTVTDMAAADAGPAGTGAKQTDVDARPAEAATDTGLKSLSSSASLNVSTDDNPSANGDFIQNIAVHDEPVIFQLLISGGDVLLSMVESTHAHGMFPYSVGEWPA